MATQLGDLGSLQQPELVVAGSDQAANLLQVDASLDLADVAQRLGSSTQVRPPMLQTDPLYAMLRKLPLHAQSFRGVMHGGITAVQPSKP